jgi:cobyrinic acid a,c-diamide synthase
MFFGGGFPEVFAEQLSLNSHALMSVLESVEQGMPTYAECGGLIYLSRQLLDHHHNIWPMVGAIPHCSRMTSTLTLGYRKSVALAESSLLKKGQQVIGHEFHYSQLSTYSTQPLFQMSRYASKYSGSWLEGCSSSNLHASYLHLHFAHDLSLAKRFLKNCLDFSKNFY